MIGLPVLALLAFIDALRYFNQASYRRAAVLGALAVGGVVGAILFQYFVQY